MPGIIEELRERHETTLDAAKELVRGLMRGYKPDFKLGYSWENAELAATGAFGLPKLDAFEVKFYALGFARGMHDVSPAAEDGLVERIGKVSARYSDAYVAGRAAGLSESDDKNPTALPFDEIVDGLAGEAPDDEDGACD